MFDLKSIRTSGDNAPRYYVLEDEGLKTAIQMAIWLGKPLLLTGAPGTGKTQLAFKVADMLSAEGNINAGSTAKFLNAPFVFNTKTTSTATDLFYYYDAVRHFQRRYVDEQEQNENRGQVIKTTEISGSVDHDSVEVTKIEYGKQISTAHAFIKMNALGRAILQAWGKDAILANDKLKDMKDIAEFDELANEPRSSVVLIDEIDKAPRDFPNDLLYEIENMQFSVSELMNKHIGRPQTNAQVVVIMTSNFEKNLPDAFLRRCLFYHIPFPETAGLMKIVAQRIQPHLQELYKEEAGRLADVSKLINDNLEIMIKKFEEIRSSVKEKQPATAELLEWIKALERQGFFNGGINFDKLEVKQKEIFQRSLPALAKSDEDLTALKKKYA